MNAQKKRRIESRNGGLRRLRERGAAAVEFALVLPLLLMLVLGAIDYGYFFYVDQVVTYAAREGARGGTLWADTTASENDARSMARTALGQGGLNPDLATITITHQTAGTPAVGSVRVRISYPTSPSLTGFADVIVPATAHATAEMRR